MLTMQEIDPFEECFTHLSEDSAVTTTYATSRLRAWIESHPDQVERGCVPVDAEHAEYCLRERGVEQSRLNALMAHPEHLTKPIIFVHQPDGSHLLVDGTHRYVIWHHCHQTQIPAYVVEWTVAEAFIIADAPQVTDREAFLAEDTHLTMLRALGLTPES